MEKEILDQKIDVKVSKRQKDGLTRRAEARKRVFSDYIRMVFDAELARPVSKAKGA